MAVIRKLPRLPYWRPPPVYFPPKRVRFPHPIPPIPKPPIPKPPIPKPPIPKPSFPRWFPFPIHFPPMFPEL